MKLPSSRDVVRLDMMVTPDFTKDGRLVLGLLPLVWELVQLKPSVHRVEEFSGVNDSFEDVSHYKITLLWSNSPEELLCCSLNSVVGLQQLRLPPACTCLAPTHLKTCGCSYTFTPYD